MDGLNLFVAEALIAERQRELEAIGRSSMSAAPQHAEHGVRHALAATIVRFGLRLDPAAGEGLGRTRAELAGHKGGC